MLDILTYKMNNARKIRQDQFRQFSRLHPEEQLAWALRSGHTLWQLMPKGSKRYAENLRNGWKKYLKKMKKKSGRLIDLADIVLIREKQGKK